jgi:lipid A ethanolaminephosphotransferase
MDAGEWNDGLSTVAARTWIWLLGGAQRASAWLAGSRLRFALVVAALLVLGYNLPFWRGSLAAVGGASLRGVSFLVLLAILLIAIHMWLLLLVPGRRLLPLVSAALLILASTVLFYESALHVFFDQVMVRNVFETDAAEARDLLSPLLAGYVLVIGVLPAIVIARVRLVGQTLPRRLGVLGAFTLGTVAVVAAFSVAFPAHLASYLREHKSLRYLVNPLNVVYGAAAYAIGQTETERPFEYVEGRVVRMAVEPDAKPLLVMLVVGETARAANFELGGYSRPTNPELGRRTDLIYFSDVRSCGTSTATSLPCMFSHLGRDAFDVDRAPTQSNVLDAAVRGGVDVEWRDNNSGCKHVCDRVREVEVRGAECPDEHCFDEMMTDGLAGPLDARRSDRLIVMHQAGSHGPAYYERYPRDFARFQPDCRTRELARCERQLIVNAYDNSILYTDHVLAGEIALLETFADRYDTLLLYVSDHGESLGENGVYLHAAPYFVAPDQQTQVPMLVWMSEGYRRRARIDMTCLRARASQPASHDNLYHTLLGSLGVQSDAYQADHDLLAGCRRV